MEHIYFVYIIETLDGTPLYVGKGKNNRPQAHFDSKANSYIARKIRKLGADNVRISFIQENLLSADAYLKETELIAKYGRRDNGTGILYNLSDGGEGSKGHRMTNEGKQFLRELNLGKKASDTTKEKLRQVSLGRQVTWGDKIKTSLTGISHTDERRKNQSIAAINRIAKMSKEDLSAKMKHMANSRDTSRGNNSQARQCSVNDIVYSCVTEAAEQLKWSRKRVRNHFTFKYIPTRTIIS